MCQCRRLKKPENSCRCPNLNMPQGQIHEQRTRSQKLRGGLLNLRLLLRRRVDFLEKAIADRDEGQLREAAAAARKVALPDDDEEVARVNAILGSLASLERA